MPGQTILNKTPYNPFGKTYTWDAGANYFEQNPIQPIWKKLHMGCRAKLF
jgi:hypothetical protein